MGGAKQICAIYKAVCPSVGVSVCVPLPLFENRQYLCNFDEDNAHIQSLDYLDTSDLISNPPPFQEFDLLSVFQAGF